ncbi:transmembrane protein 180 [Lingula anatina]|uniref:Transmembrane protein 180 n=1 Tax=Lingula anatina TaxID=7574 RepID=A0A1S3ILC6_LINAN|nr:transmembrane protein 180 [Lingula anatina]|eukprot:XP_013398691.1 transmembrane protein 180 [Lingula anatina]
MMVRIHWPSVAYATTSVGATMMNEVFMFYYVKFFLNLYHISEEWFNVAQVIFMIWNAINDPLFGYCQDNSNLACVRKRRHAVLYGGPFFALSFLVPWFPWGNYQPGISSWLCGLHLVVALCFYDAMFTFVLLAQCCIFTEMSGKHQDRLRLIKYAQLAAFAGSGSVFFANLFSDNLKKIGEFQCYTMLIAMIAFLCMSYTGIYADTEYDLKPNSLDSQNRTDQAARSSKYSMLQLTWQLLRQRNFICFVLMNFCQVLHRTFLLNFTAIITDMMIPQEILPSVYRSVFYGFVTVIPMMLVLLGSPLVARFGSYQIFRSSFVVKIFSSLFMLFWGKDHLYLLMVFLITDSSVTSATSSLMNMPMSDIVDEDSKLYNREHPISSMVYGTNALVIKPAISLAPMLAVAILNRNGYAEYKLGKLHSGIDQLQSSMFYLLCLIPLTLGVLQYAVWSKYTLRDSHEVIPHYYEQECTI